MDSLVIHHCQYLHFETNSELILVTDNIGYLDILVDQHCPKHNFEINFELLLDCQRVMCLQPVTIH